MQFTILFSMQWCKMLEDCSSHCHVYETWFLLINNVGGVNSKMCEHSLLVSVLPLKPWVDQLIRLINGSLDITLCYAWHSYKITTVFSESRGHAWGDVLISICNVEYWTYKVTQCWINMIVEHILPVWLLSRTHPILLCCTNFKPSV